MATVVEASASTSPTASESPPVASRVLALIAWLLTVLGVIIVFLLVLVSRREDRFVRFWIAQTVGLIIVGAVSAVVLHVLRLIPLVGPILAIIVWVVLLAVWILGAYYIIAGKTLRPPLVRLASQKIEVYLLS